MLVNLKDICAIAEQNNMAIGAFNAPNLETVRAAIATAEELHLPVIIDHAEGHEVFTPLKDIGPVMVTLAERSSAMVCVHLDHCQHLSYMKRALDMGFTGTMYDGSTLPYEENIEFAQRAAEMVSSYDCGLECELGSMGQREMGKGHENENDGHGKPIYTNPDQAKDFVARSGADILAVSFGTSHGLYKGTPHLDFSTLTEIRKRTNTPLVMHGGSGVSDEDYAKAIDAGIRKVNYFTYGSKFAGERVAEVVDKLRKQGSIPYYHDITVAAHDELCKTFKHVMTVFANGSKDVA